MEQMKGEDPRAELLMKKVVVGTYGSVTVIAQLFETDTVIVAFNHVGLMTSGDRFWGDIFFAKAGISAIGIMTNRPNWYPAADMSQAIAVIRAITQGQRLITYGNSHGGYGALKFSAALGATAALAFCPQSTIDRRILGEGDLRYSGYYEEGVSGGDPIAAADLCATCYILYDRWDVRDELNVALIRAQGPSIGGPSIGGPIIAVTAPFTPHGTVSLVAESGLASKFIALFLAPALPSPHAIKRLLRAARARSTTYAVHRAHHLVPRLPAYAGALRSGLRRMPPGPRRIMLAVHLAEAGRFDRACRLLERADPALLDRFGLIMLWKLFRRKGNPRGELLMVGIAMRLHPEDPIIRIYAVNSFMQFRLLQEANETLASTIDEFGRLPHFTQLREFAAALGQQDMLARMDVPLSDDVAVQLSPSPVADGGGTTYQATDSPADEAEEVGSMDWLAWETVGGRPQIRATDGTITPILNHLGLAPVIVGGWRLRGIYAGFAPFILADLTHEDGSVGFWIIDPEIDRPNLRIIGNDVTPPIDGSGAFQAAVAARVQEVAQRMLTDPAAPHDPMVRSFMRLSRGLRQRLCATLPPATIEGPHPRQIDLATTADTAWPIVTRAGAAITLEMDLMMRALHHYLHERFLDACAQRRLRWPALTQLGLGDRVHAIFFRSDLGVLRCIDPSTGTLYYIVLVGADIRSVAVLVPDAGLIFTYSNGAPTIFIGMLAQSPGMIGAALARHLLCAPASYLDWLAQPPTSFAQFTWPETAAHLGHFLWNEASGLERIREALKPEDYPEIVNLVGPSGCEFYAPLETLYPEFRGRVNNTLATVDAMQDHAYAHALQPIRVSDALVSSALRQRVMAVVAADPEVAMLSRMGGPALDPAIPMIVLGLRLSDRTHADLGGFYARVIRHLLHQTPRLAKRLTVVIDGLNARPGRAGVPFRVFSGSDAPTDLYAREKSLVAQLRADTASLPVDIIDCVGVGMRINLFWIDRAQMFIAPWGAGLVKYRWVCNKPGFVFSSRNNLTQPHHLPIYHLPLFMDDPAPIEFVDPAYVTDLRAPGELLDADGRDAQEQRGGLSAVNFTFDDPPVLAAIAELFQRTSIGQLTA